ncbi:hypothetical protein L596_010032 [Steinernema carpocapsae]|uniref:Complex 1 LYR protein domain-containing protein n=1 Tax=Steinernema carpocapsae TaxID=34508 RepID=A0A4U5PHB5_STECR|nr:hypothetical protein L596_010032 [Steinernema carpocapsae]
MFGNGGWRRSASDAFGRGFVTTRRLVFAIFEIAKPDDFEASCETHVALLGIESMASSITRASWVQLYKDLQRAAREFPQYNYREFSKRRVREYFVESRNVTEEKELKKLYKLGKESLATIKRQTAISKSLPSSKLVIEQ